MGGLFPCDVFLENEKARNRSQEGDTVVLQLLPETEWVSIKPPVGQSSTTLEDAMEKLDLDDLICVREGGLHEPLKSTGCSSDSLATARDLWRPQLQLNASREDKKRPTDTLCEQGRLALQSRLQPRGKVVYILEDKHRKEHMGTLVPSSPLTPEGRLSNCDSYLMFHPADKRVPYMLIARGECPMQFLECPAAFANSIFIAQMKSTWLPSSKLPWGGAVRCIGEAGMVRPETDALLAQFGVDHGDFPQSVLRSLRAFLPQSLEGRHDVGVNTRRSPWKIPEEEILKRRDLRTTRVFTIDPTSAKDLDDALHVTQLEGGIVEVGVHIADVSYFFPPNSDLDREARRRGTTVYLVQQVVPMFPPLLCEELCSLNPNVDRLAFSCVWRMHADGTLLDEAVWFGRTVIRSCCKLDYQTAQRVITGEIQLGHPDSIPADLWDPSRRPVGFGVDEVAKDVLLLHKVAKRRRAKRFESGALSLNTVKLHFQLDVNGNPVEFGSYPRRDSNELVEEYMLLANYLVAQQLLVHGGGQALLRGHPEPIRRVMDEVKESLMKCGVILHTESSGAIQQSMIKVSAMLNDPSSSEAVTSMVTGPMQPAFYFAAGCESQEVWCHYALNIPYYTHFTSPIRRYADVIVHRLLSATLEGGDAMSHPYSVEQLAQTAHYCNMKRLDAKKAQERSDEVFLAVYLQGCPLEREAVVTSVGQMSFTVLVTSLGISSRLHLDMIEGINSMSRFNHVEETLELQASSQSTHKWTTLSVKVLTKIMVHCSSKKTVPVEIQVRFVRPV
ncbi:unnamed protein product [Choristocarpus tenellus]